jgi:putative hemolysin
MSIALLEILIILFLILLNGLLAMSEIAVVSARKIRLEQRSQAGSATARAALELANNPNNFLSTVQIGITLVGILAGAFGGATIAKPLQSWLEQTTLPFLSSNSQAISVTLVVLAITYLSLILGELAPKQIALANPETIAAAIALPMKRLSQIASPLVRLLGSSTNLILKILGIQPTSEPAVTEEEIKLLLQQAKRGGIIEPSEEEMIDQVFRLGDRRISALITPRPDIHWLDLDDPVERLKDQLSAGSHSYYPVARGDLDNAIGLIKTKDLLARLLAGKAFDLSSELLKPLFLPENMPVLEAIESFRENKVQIALVIDEYGGIQGLLTTTDILEAIAGDFPEHGDTDTSEIVRREDGSWLLDGRLAIDRFKDLLGFKELDREGERAYETLGGFVMTYLGRVPTEGDYFDVENYRLEVVDMDELRVDKVLVSATGNSSTAEE